MVSKFFTTDTLTLFSVYAAIKGYTLFWGRKGYRIVFLMFHGKHTRKQKKPRKMAFPCEI